MNEYIERDALIAEFERLSLGENSLVEKFFAHGVYAVIETFPAADVEPVIRCKDCAHFIKKPPTYPILGNCVHLEMLMLENDFCSHGERRVRNGLK